MSEKRAGKKQAPKHACFEFLWLDRRDLLEERTQAESREHVCVGAALLWGVVFSFPR